MQYMSGDKPKSALHLTRLNGYGEIMGSRVRCVLFRRCLRPCPHLITQFGRR